MDIVKIEEFGVDTRPLSTSWHSYPKSWAIGHRCLKDLFLDDVTVEEKVDGSQFSFGVFDGELKVRSKSVVMNLDIPEKMFLKAIETVQSIKDRLVAGWTYRCEYLGKPKHNSLCYERTPNNYLIGFDINPSHESYLTHEEKRMYFDYLGLETVPLLYQGKVENYEFFRELLKTPSVLGCQLIEGVVIKNYSRFGPDGRILMGKFVSEEFKEIHNGDWQERNPGNRDVVQKLIEEYKTPARWNKSIFRLRDAGKLENSPRDIGPLIRSIQDDIKEECAAEIKEKLFVWAWDQIARSVSHGFPQYYKEQLAKSAFNEEEAPACEEK